MPGPIEDAEQRLGVRLPDAYRAWARAPQTFQPSSSFEDGAPEDMDALVLLEPERLHWISGSNSPTEDDLLVVGRLWNGSQLVLRLKQPVAGGAATVSAAVFEVESANSGAVPRRIATAFSQLIDRKGPDGFVPDDEREKWAARLLGLSATPPDEERPDAERRMPELFRAARLLDAVAGEKLKQLRSSPVLVRTAGVLRLETDRERIVDRLMGIYESAGLGELEVGPLRRSLREALPPPPCL